jgi:hypothetical protein
MRRVTFALMRMTSSIAPFARGCRRLPHKKPSPGTPTPAISTMNDILAPPSRGDDPASLCPTSLMRLPSISVR